MVPQRATRQFPAEHRKMVNIVQESTVHRAKAVLCPDFGLRQIGFCAPHA
jgi:hypothetical protein